ncbi:MAG: hypothetical protein RBG1_1C00001G1786 [candidate division Zixibacteria bacterium RBG-1]|nr:MAG: hypothetical protein RBG1_1C00001G1786 [candidate division Zixibacteria bacterium RBG-1]OGC84183.1 MAG: hypothetical protein A2V73_08925 [candidate division Zixibacteria bacterium RBG_19FT_COMBO_42_43]
MFSKVGLLVLGLFTLTVWGGQNVIAETQSNLVNQYFSKLDYRDYSKQMDLSNFFEAQAESLPKAPGETKDIYQFKTKSAKKAFLYSLVLPGAGQYYLGSKIKPVVYLGLEAAFWIGYFSYHNKGEDKEKAYKFFADLYWDSEKYIDSLTLLFSDSCAKDGGCNGLDTSIHTKQDSVMAMEEYLGFSHHLQFSKNQQYYENAGKYDQFRYGWSDYDVDFYDSTKSPSPFRQDYLDQRKKANDLYGKATTFAMVSLANHVLSAFEAAISTRSYNRKGEKFAQASLKMRLGLDEEGNLTPKATVTIKF